MTICIAAICESGKRLVVAADRMFTASAPLNLEFETEETKIETLSPTCIALSSGGSAYATEVLRETRKGLAGANQPKILDVANLVSGNYATIRSRKVNETIIVPALGADLAAFLGRGGTLPGYLQGQPMLYQQLVAMSTQFNLNLEIIVAGLDDTGAYISRITHPGTMVQLDKLGYDAIGSGGIHALTKLYLGAQTVHRDLVKTLYSVYEAKRAAEVAPGVGTVTDIGVVSSDGFWPCPAPLQDALDKCFKNMNARETTGLTEVKEALDDALKS